MIELASIIGKHADAINAHLTAEKLPTPSFDADCPPDLLLDQSIAASRQLVLEATDELHALVLGPAGILTNDSRHYYNFWSSLHAIYRFGLSTCFPEGEDETTFANISAVTGLAESHVQRLLRHAMTFRIFQEPRRGIVRHTAASKMLAKNHRMRQWIGMTAEDFWPAATKVLD
ncbi:MAG: hypothetical protein Q9191_001664 [Dirinaria sp. TL-2023a]